MRLLYQRALEQFEKSGGEGIAPVRTKGKNKEHQGTQDHGTPGKRPGKGQKQEETREHQGRDQGNAKTRSHVC